MRRRPRRLLPAATLGALLALGTGGCDQDLSKPVTQTVPRTRQAVEKIENERQQQVDELDRMEAESRPQPPPEDE